MKPITVIARYRTELFDEECYPMERLESHAWLSKKQKGRLYGIKGVSTGEVDLLIVATPPRPDWVQVVELAEKAGKYDGTKRLHITYRWLPPCQAPSEKASLFVTFLDEPSKAVVELGGHKFTFSRWRSELSDPEKIASIVRWHYSRYYDFLAEEAIDACAYELPPMVLASRMTLAEANRAASRLLYRAARSAGWRKLTLREQARLGLHGQWHPEDRYARAQEILRSHYSNHSATGASEYTLDCARRGVSSG